MVQTNPVPTGVMTPFGAQTAIFWFRRDLRTNDNTGLAYAFQKHQKVVGVFIVPPEVSKRNFNALQLRQLQNVLDKLRQELKDLDSELVIIQQPAHQFFEAVQAAEVIWNKEYEPKTLHRDHAVSAILNQKGIHSRSFKDHVLLEPEEILKKDGSPYRVFTPYSRVWKQKISSNLLFNSEIQSKYNTEFPLGILRNYQETKDQIGLDKTSKLGFALRFGTVSIRALYQTSATISPSFVNQLIWRDFFTQLLYHFPQNSDAPYRKKFEWFEWDNNPERFEHWCQGTTGFPLVDAGMRQLRETGFMHNRVRMLTASFLSKNLLIDYRWGEQWFAQNLLDFDLASNNGNWQWAAGTGCDAAPYFRIFSPSLQLKKFDPDLKYLKKWLPSFFEGKYGAPIIDYKASREIALSKYASINPQIA